MVTDPSVIVAYLLALSILPVVNLWEGTAWMGVVQARLADQRGPLLAAVITGPLFVVVHLPLPLGRPAGRSSGCRPAGGHAVRNRADLYLAAAW